MDGSWKELGPCMAGLDVDTIQPKRCGCVPQISLVYEDIHRSRGTETLESNAGGGRHHRGGWASRIPLLGPFWCVKGTNGTTVRRRDNAVYRSNSFKFERRGPEEGGVVPFQGAGLNLEPIMDQVMQTKKQIVVRKDQEHALDDSDLHQILRPPVRNKHLRKGLKSAGSTELMLNLNYSDPQDAESEVEYWGNVNQAYEEGEDEKDKVDTEKQLHQMNHGPGYKVKFGQDIYYCKPYQPFHTQLRYNFSDLLESGVDSEYEEMAGSRGQQNHGSNNNTEMGQCSTCVTVINVCPSPGHTIKQGTAVVPQPKLTNHARHLHPPSDLASSCCNGKVENEPPYENLSFHKVTINVPDVSEESHDIYGEKPRVILRKPPIKKSRVPLRYQGIKRVKSKSKTQQSYSHGATEANDKYGYNQKEVWNWLHLDEDVQNDKYLYLESSIQNLNPKEKGVSVQFSPAEFVQATNRLAHLNLEGFERFVGNTIDRAIAGARAKSSDVLDKSQSKEMSVKDSPDQSHVDTHSSGKNSDNLDLNDSGRDTDVYVSKESSKKQLSCKSNCKSKPVRPLCDSCLRSGDSSCSSALSSLESIKSSQGSGGVTRSREAESDSSARGSLLSSNEDRLSGNTGKLDQNNKDLYARCATPRPGAEMTSQDYMKMSGQKIYRGRVRASLPVSGQHSQQVQQAAAAASSYSQLTSQHKPYQTLEVNLQQDPMPGVQGHINGGGQHREKQHQLLLVDPAIQLHQQEWYHGNVSRLEAETALRLHPPGSYLVRNCESAKRDYSLSLKSSHGFMHMRIQLTPSGHYILGQFSRPFKSIADMINYYTINRLPIKGAEHVSLKMPLCEQLL